MNGETGAARRAGSNGPGILLALLVFTTVVLPPLLANAPGLVTACTDDAFYYFGVARQVAAGHGITFDGRHPTNGFQPLWLLAILPIIAGLPGDRPPLIGILVLQALLLLAAAILIRRLLARRAGEWTATLTVLALFALPGARWLAAGMEAALVLLAFVLTWRAWVALDEERAPDAWRGLAFGLATALLFLARLESVAGVAAAVALLSWGRRGTRPAWRPAVWAGMTAPPALVIGAYIAWNQIQFGTPLPVSGQVKAFWVSRLPVDERLAALVDPQWPGRDLAAMLLPASLGPRAVPLAGAILMVLALGVALVFRRRFSGVVATSGCAFPLVAGPGIAVVDHLVIGRFLGEWATMPIRLATAIALGLLLARCVSCARVAAVLMVVALIARAPLARFRGGDWETTFNGRAYVVARALDEGTAPGTVVASPVSGVLGYYSHRSMINLDGLVNSPTYLDQVVRGGRFEEYLRAERPDLLVDIDCGADSPQAGLRWVLGRLPRGEGCLVREPGITAPDDGSGCTLATWRVDPSACEVTRP